MLDFGLLSQERAPTKRCAHNNDYKATAAGMTARRSHAQKEES